MSIRSRWIRAALWWAVAGLCLAAAPAEAQTVRWVTDKLQVTVRTGPSTENKIIHVADSGDQLTVLAPEEDGWIKVGTPDGQEGWMMVRYLQNEPTAAIKLDKLDPQNQTLLQQLEDQTKTNQELKANLARLESENLKLENAYTKLKKEAAGFMTLKKEHQDLLEDYQRQGEQINNLAAELESLRFGGNLKWFMAGAGVLVLGWLMGLAMGRRRRRNPASLY